MKVTIEKKIETLADLRLAKAYLQQKAKAQEEALRENGLELYHGLSASRAYHEALESFGMENLITNNLPYLLKLQSNFGDGNWAQKLKSVSKTKWAAIAGFVAAAGAGWWYIRKRNAPQPDETAE